MKQNNVTRSLPTLSKRLKGVTFSCYSVNTDLALVTSTVVMEQPPEKMQEQDRSGQSQSAHLTQEWQRFFPGRSFGDVVKDFAYYIRAHEQHEFDKYDSLLYSLDEEYFRTVEPTRFLDLIYAVWQLLQPIVADSEKGLALFEEFGIGAWWLDEQERRIAPMDGYPHNNLSRAKAALRRVEQWLKIRRLAPSDQLIALMQSIPVIVWHERQPGSYSKTTVSLPRGKGEHFAHMLDTLWNETKREIEGQKKRIAKVTRERIVEKLLPITRIEQVDIDELEQRQQVENGLQCLEQLPRYYPFMNWGGLRENTHVLPGAQLSIHFWHALEFSMGIRRISAEAICKKLAANEEKTPKQSNANSELRLTAPDSLPTEEVRVDVYPESTSLLRTRSIAELCTDSFSKEAIEFVLLQMKLVGGNPLRLEIKNKKGVPYLTIPASGKAQGYKSKLMAVYCVLLRDGLLKSNSDAEEWSAALQTEYGASLGNEVIKYKLDTEGDTSDAFRDAVPVVERIIERWSDSQVNS